MASFGPYPATVSSIHDADTFRVLVDLGFFVRFLADVRLYGCNAPELSTVAGRQARDYLETLVKPGDPVTLLSHGPDKYGGRWDGTVTLNDGRDLATLLIAAGHAVAWDGEGPKPG